MPPARRTTTKRGRVVASAAVQVDRERSHESAHSDHRGRRVSVCVCARLGSPCPAVSRSGHLAFSAALSRSALCPAVASLSSYLASVEDLFTGLQRSAPPLINLPLPLHQSGKSSDNSATPDLLAPGILAVCIDTVAAQCALCMINTSVRFRSAGIELPTAPGLYHLSR